MHQVFHKTSGVWEGVDYLVQAPSSKCVRHGRVWLNCNRLLLLLWIALLFHWIALVALLCKHCSIAQNCEAFPCIVFISFCIISPRYPDTDSSLYPYLYLYFISLQASHHIALNCLLALIAVDHLGLAKCLPVAHNTPPNNSITIVINIKEIIIIVIVKFQASLARICIITTS